MRYSYLIASAFVACASAGPLKRDLPTVQAAFAAVSKAITELDTDVLAITAGGDVPTTIATLNADSNAVVSALNTGAANVNASTPLTLLDSLGLLDPSNALINITNQTINDAISKHDIIAAVNQSDAVVQALNAQKAATQGFTAALVSKSPDQVVSVVQSQGQKVIDSINRGILAYGGTVSRKSRRDWTLNLLRDLKA